MQNTHAKKWEVEDIVESLEGAVFSDKRVSYGELFDAAHEAVVHKKSEKLYTGVVHLFDIQCASLYNELKSVPNDQLLTRFAQTYKTYCERLTLVIGTLMHLDATWVLRTKRLSIKLVGYGSFWKAVFAPLREPLETALNVLIERRRLGERVDLHDAEICVTAAREMWPRNTGVVFSATVLRVVSEKWHKTQCKEKLKTLSVPNFLRWIDECKAVESEFDNAFTILLGLQFTSVPDETIKNNIQWVIHNETSGMMHMLVHHDIPTLAQLYRMLKADFDLCLSVFSAYIREFEKTDMAELLQFKRKADEIIRDSFQGDARAHKMFKDAFTFLMSSKRRSKDLVMYIDECMRRAEPMSLSEMYGVTELFSFLSDKDVFEILYRAQLCKRLMSRRFAPVHFDNTNENGMDAFKRVMSQRSPFDAELDIANRLQNECGTAYSSKIKGMIMDMSQQPTTLEGAVKLNATMLSSGHWPLTTDVSIRLPPAMEEMRLRFENAYVEQHSGRKVVWSYESGSCDVEVMGYELNVSVYQCAALSLFSPTRTHISFLEFAEELGIPKKALRRHLVSLTTSRCPLLLKTGEKRKLCETDVYSFNASFSSPVRRIKVALVALEKEPEEMTDAETQEIVQNRRDEMESVIMRVMKSRKTLSHSDLMRECLEKMRFTPKVSDMKLRIASLIEREYLARDEQNPSVYVYT